MSYEGYEQVLCTEGHLSQFDAYGDGYEVFMCNYCGSPSAFVHTVDLTNGVDEDDPDTLPYPFEVKQEFKEECSLGFEHILQATVYVIPKDISSYVWP